MKNRILFAAIALVAVAIWGCTKPAAPPASSSTGSPDSSATADSVESSTTQDASVAQVSSGTSNTTQANDLALDDIAVETTVVSLVYCGDCGHSFGKGSEHTCDADHAKCEVCGLHKGSDLCCKIEGDVAGKTLCGKCGEIGGSEACCKEGAEVCEKCSLHKGSPLCCKLGEKAAAPAEGAPAEAAPAKEGEG